MAGFEPAFLPYSRPNYTTNFGHVKRKMERAVRIELTRTVWWTVTLPICDARSENCVGIFGILFGVFRHARRDTGPTLVVRYPCARFHKRTVHLATTKSSENDSATLYILPQYYLAVKRKMVAGEGFEPSTAVYETAELPNYSIPRQLFLQ